MPGFEGRLGDLKIHTKKMSVDDNLSLQELALKADGATGADLKAICTEAGMFAIRDNRDSVSMLDFERAIVKVLDNEAANIVESGVMFA